VAIVLEPDDAPEALDAHDRRDMALAIAVTVGSLAIMVIVGVLVVIGSA
jgi:hypothetical protein